ncbi:hypothetical protein COLO4_09617 [Corchorus olitorius]|uniref:FBD domain-containing protein n=1 Tax=Corchorus olitorius TaxID=93759 RepID=A0A1R3KBH4_9ROSI|nr:hypothetical protein COLO4_09617 [Corchorus olitorius]
MSGRDRLSSLGDDILIRILSLLPSSHDSIRTSCLSSRFRHLWKSVPILDCRDNLCRANTFENFMNNALLHHELRIWKFRLRVYDRTYYIRNSISSWIQRSAIASSVHLEDFDVHLPYDIGTYRYVNLPSAIFSCRRLKILRLSGGVRIDDIPCGVVFPCLKTLELVTVSFVRNPNLNNLLPSAVCPMLETFHLENCSIGVIEEIGDDYIYYNIVFLIKYIRGTMGEISDYCSSNQLSTVNSAPNMDPTFMFLKKVEQLEICPADDFLEFIGEKYNQPVFNNLTNLVIRKCGDFHPAFFMKHSPNLTSLIVEDDDVRIVEQFLKNALVLKKLVLRVQEGLTDRMKADILREPRASSQWSMTAHIISEIQFPVGFSVLQLRVQFILKTFMFIYLTGILIIIDDIPSDVIFPCLKTLELVSVDFVRNPNVNNLLPSAVCPMLQTFHLENCSIGIIEQNRHYDQYKFVIQYIRGTMGEISDYCSSGQFSTVNSAPNMDPTFMFLNKVEQLEIYPADFVKFISEKYNQPVFNNLTNLVIRKCGDFHPAFLLKHSPNLTSLVVEDFRVDRNKWIMSPKATSSLLWNVERIEIINKSMTKDNVRIVEQFLKNALVLKKLVLRVQKGLTDRMKADILREPRASTQCDIEFHPYKSLK